MATRFDLVKREVTIFRARKILTLEREVPVVDAVAVCDGKVLHTGTFDDVVSDLVGWSVHIDDRFDSDVIVPGFVEAHCHALEEGALAGFPWVGTYDRRSASGAIRKGCPTTTAAIERIRDAHREINGPKEILTCLGWDPTLAQGGPITKDLLDSVSTERPIFVLQSNGHVGHCNSALMRLIDVDSKIDVHGVVLDTTGKPTGELREMALTLVLGRLVDLEKGGDESVRNIGELARQVGCTTITDLAFAATANAITEYSKVVNTSTFPTRIVYAPFVQVLDHSIKGSVFDHVASLAAFDTAKFRRGPIKFVLDGSIQGRSARLNWPGYCCGDPNGMWLAEPEEMIEMMRPYHQHGYQLALHTNGDEAVDRGIDVYNALLDEFPRYDHRHRLEHAQLASNSAFHRMKSLGICVNLFSNHNYYFGDVHRNTTAGPAKARRLNACATAEQLGIPFSIHCDAPVTPLNPLFTAWCAVNRVTSSGFELGSSERISPLSALKAITLGAAHLLKMDHEIGSIEVGKHADFAILDKDPTEIDPMKIRDIRVRGTVLAGVAQHN